MYSQFSRLADFLLQLQSYEGAPKTLCQIVGHSLDANNNSDE